MLWSKLYQLDREKAEPSLHKKRQVPTDFGIPFITKPPYSTSKTQSTQNTSHISQTSLQQHSFGKRAPNTQHDQIPPLYRPPCRQRKTNRRRHIDNHRLRAQDKLYIQVAIILLCETLQRQCIGRCACDYAGTWQ